MAKIQIITTMTNGKYESTEGTGFHKDDKGHYMRGRYKKGGKTVTGEVFIPFHGVASIENIEGEQDDKE